MSVIGVIYTAFQTEEYLDMSLSPWMAARAARTGGHDYLICAVSVPFEGFPIDGPQDDTHRLLENAAFEGLIDHVIADTVVMREVAARGAALRWLTERGADLIVQVDSDEAYTDLDIERIMGFISASPFVPCFRFSLRNAVFTPDQYLAAPFTPMRAHRVQVGGYRADSFWDDNNILYRHSPNADHFKRDADMACLTVPPSVAWIKHYTWISNLRSKRKVEYQTARGWECSFRWDEAANELRFNEAYYERRGERLPEVLRDERCTESLS